MDIASRLNRLIAGDRRRYDSVGPLSGNLFLPHVNPSGM